MRISARNVKPCTVASVEMGAVNCVVTLTTDLGATLKADITCEAARELGLEAGKRAYAVVKASNVMMAAGDQKVAVSARNQRPGKVLSVTCGAVNCSVKFETELGGLYTASITNEAADELGLEAGKPALAFFKSTDVMVAVD